MSSGYAFIRTMVQTRSKGHTATGAVCYRMGLSGTSTIPGRDGGDRAFDYTRRTGILATGYAAPPGTDPSWSEPLKWAHRIEAVDKRKNSRQCRDDVVAVPIELVELGLAEEAIQAYADRLADLHNTVVQWAFHGPGRGEKNYHAHVLYPGRHVEGLGFSKHRDRGQDNPTHREEPDLVTRHKGIWSEICQGRGIELKWTSGAPAHHLGPQICATKRRRMVAELGDRIRETVVASETGERVPDQRVLTDLTEIASGVTDGLSVHEMLQLELAEAQQGRPAPRPVPAPVAYQPEVLPVRRVEPEVVLPVQANPSVLPPARRLPEVLLPVHAPEVVPPARTVARVLPPTRIAPSVLQPAARAPEVLPAVQIGPRVLPPARRPPEVLPAVREPEVVPPARTVAGVLPPTRIAPPVLPPVRRAEVPPAVQIGPAVLPPVRRPPEVLPVVREPEVVPPRRTLPLVLPDPVRRAVTVVVATVRQGGPSELSTTWQAVGKRLEPDMSTAGRCARAAAEVLSAGARSREKGRAVQPVASPSRLKALADWLLQCTLAAFEHLGLKTKADTEAARPGAAATGGGGVSRPRSPQAETQAMLESTSALDRYLEDLARQLAVRALPPVDEEELAFSNDSFDEVKPMLDNGDDVDEVARQGLDLVAAQHQHDTDERERAEQRLHSVAIELAIQEERKLKEAKSKLRLFRKATVDVSASRRKEIQREEIRKSHPALVEKIRSVCRRSLGRESVEGPPEWLRSAIASHSEPARQVPRTSTRSER